MYKIRLEGISEGIFSTKSISEGILEGIFLLEKHNEGILEGIISGDTTVSDLHLKALLKLEFHSDSTKNTSLDITFVS